MAEPAPESTPERTPERTNEEWLAELLDAGRDEALADLRVILVRGLRYAMADQPNVSEADLEDFAQDAPLKILAGLDSFRGESRFTTWAQKTPSAWPSPNCAADGGRTSRCRTWLPSSTPQT